MRTRGRDAFYLPGGKREPGESDVAAPRREVHEELGIELEPASLTLPLDHLVTEGRLAAG